MKKLILSLVAIATISLTSFGQAPEGFKYQAVVRDGGGIILTNQTVGYQLTILQTSPSGTAVYTETFALTTNTYGLVNLEIGSGTVVSGTFATIDWAAGPYFIETAVDVTGGTSYVVMGTSELMSVPYALYAKTSGSSVPGPQGAQGPAGNDGISAFEVWIGLGNTGTETDFINSLTGPQGAMGPQGLTGNDGVQGATGPQGLTGPQGPTGNAGAQGPVGTDGLALNWLGTFAVAPGVPNSNDAYYNSTDGMSYIWSGSSWQLVAQDGAVGATGPQGAMGPQGLTGNDGVQGATGPQGLQGPQGLTGPQGPAGDLATVTVVTAGTGVNVTGTGTGVDPYVVNSTGPTYTIGLWPELGGYVFWVSADGKHGLVAETQDQGYTSWYEAQNLISNPSNHSVNGQKFRDWRLPTKYELNEMYLQQLAVGGFANNGYWSSTELDYGNAWDQGFTNGLQLNYYKNGNLFVRSVRAF